MKLLSYQERKQHKGQKSHESQVIRSPTSHILSEEIIEVVQNAARTGLSFFPHLDTSNVRHVGSAVTSHQRSCIFYRGVTTSRVTWEDFFFVSFRVGGTQQNGALLPPSGTECGSGLLQRSRTYKFFTFQFLMTSF